MKDDINFLLIDDDLTFTEVMARGLSRKGFKVEIANDAEQAIACAEAQRPDYILLDLNLPGRSGLLLLPDLVNKAPSAKIIMLTAYSSIATAVDAMKLGAKDYLCKPATINEIIAAFESEPGRPADVSENPISVERLEWEHIQKVLKQQEGNISATAKALGMHRRTLQRKLQKRPVKQ